MLTGVAGVEGRRKRKHVVPDPVTTPRRGPLWLRTHQMSREQARGGGQRGRDRRPQLLEMSITPLLPRKVAKNSLNRLPVVLLQRPLDQIEASLGGLSGCLLQERLQEMALPCDMKTVKLPHLHPMMKYSPINNGLHGNSQQKSHTQEEGNMAVSVTPTNPPPPPSLISPAPSQTRGRTSLHLGQSTLTSPPPPPPPPALLTHSPTSHPPLPLPTPHDPLTVTPEPSLQDQITRSYLNHLPLSSSSPCPSIRGSSLAPPSLQAIVTHRRKPLTQQTALRGHRIFL